MVKVGMDTDSPGNQAGYDADPQYNVIGFSALHDSGTGGGASLSNFKLFPLGASCTASHNDSNTPNDSDTPYQDCRTSIESRKVKRKLRGDGTPDDAASPGYFSTNLSTGIRVELTATRRTALHRYTFPPSPPPSSSSHSTQTSGEKAGEKEGQGGGRGLRMVVDITEDGQGSSSAQEMRVYPGAGRVVGGATFAASFGPGTYRAYTCVDFRVAGWYGGPPTEWGAYVGDLPVGRVTGFDGVYGYFRGEQGALLTFPSSPSSPSHSSSSGTTTILARVGVSFISAEQACENAEEEVPGVETIDSVFDAVHASARAAWGELLGRHAEDVEEVDPDMVKLFYSSLYRTHISPADYTGENPSWASSEPYYDSFYCNWDTFRTLYPLMSLHDPENFARIVRGMINIQQHEGWLPECRGATVQQWIQGGSNGDPILAEFAVKFAPQAATLNVSLDALYTALLADAELTPPNWDLQGRQAGVWKTYNFIPQDIYEDGGAPTKQVSRTLEHAFNDFTISQVARVLGRGDDAAKYAQRAGNFVNVWNPNTTVPGVSSGVVQGMMQPRFADGTWNYTDPRHCSVHDPAHATCYLDAWNRDGFYESSPLVYSQFAPQDTAKLIELHGGAEKFVKRLQFLLDENYFDSTDEPSQQIPFMFHYADRPGLSTQASRQVIAQYFNTSVGGLPGNDGAMGSYAAFYLAGMYPVPGTRQFLLSSPYFPSISFYNPVLNTTTNITAVNFKGNPKNGTGGTVFVANVTVDGTPYKSNCYLDWDVFTRGSTVELTLTDNINVTCGSGPDALPPSLSTGGFNV
ncbi:glycoside hydrolase family 92 protein [Plicaturopsis crispa FD-325 SS-3]|uniref:Glycoside hydrolase family 92 protein n=1 Tax=Plicaturopsis crispa FD-325 SS-3 TaxID=944288 RepID=A0A0C9SVU9_PLICR|nr:glycoside hydrolase family 92 protein [Plicaturopsis crispa FD-325 SS-3]